MKALLPLCVALLIVACRGSDEPGNRDAPASAPGSAFTGTIVWKATVGGGDEEGAQMFRDLAATEIRVAFGGDRVRIDRIGGMNAGTMVLLPGEGDFRWKALLLDSRKRTFERANFVNDLDDVAPDVKKSLPTTYLTALESTGETAEICGHETESFRVTQSAFVREGAVAHLWVARDLVLPRVRVQADFEWNELNSPLVLSFPGLPGAVLKAEILENDVLVTWEATEVRPGTPDAALFEVPEGFTDAERE